MASVQRVEGTSKERMFIVPCVVAECVQCWSSLLASPVTHQLSWVVELGMQQWHALLEERGLQSCSVQ